MAALEWLEIRDFCCIKRAAVKLDERGLVLLVGENRDSDAADSNGVGKTTIFKALTWCLFGETIDGDRYDEVIRYGEKSAEVKVKTTDNWCFTRGRKKGSPQLSVSRFGEDGWVDASGKAKELQAKIIEIIGFDFETFRNTVLYGQNDLYRFADPRTTDSQRKAILNKLLKISVFRECEKKAREKARALSKEIDKHEELIERLQAKVDEHDLEEIQYKIDAWEDDRERRREALVAKVRKYKKWATEAETKAEGLEEERKREAELEAALEKRAEIEEQLKAYRSKVVEEKDKLNALRRNADKWDVEIEKIEEQLGRVSGDRCPTCNASLKSGAGKKFVDGLKTELSGNEATRGEIQEDIDQQEGELEEAQEACEKLRKERKPYDDTESELRDVSRRISAAKAAIEKADTYIETAKEALKEAKGVANESNPFEGDLEKAKARVKELKSEKKKLSKGLRVLEGEAIQYDFWVKGFSGQGLPSYMMDSVMPYLTERANEYLDILSDGDITMEFSTLKETKGGHTVDQIDIRWIIEGYEGVTPSGGQRKRMELATDLALMDVAMLYSSAKERPGMLMIDEALDGLDREGQERVLKLLQEQRGKHGSIFVISHDATISDSFDHVIKLTKDGGITGLEDLS